MQRVWGFLFLWIAIAVQARAAEPIVISADRDRPEIVLISVWDHPILFPLMTSTEDLDILFLRDHERYLTLSPESARYWLPEATAPCPMMKRFPRVQVEGDEVALWTTPELHCVHERDRHLKRFMEENPSYKRDYFARLSKEYPKYAELKKIIQEKCSECAGKTFVLDAMGLKGFAEMRSVRRASILQNRIAQERADRFNRYRAVEHYGTIYNKSLNEHGLIPVISDSL